MEDEGKPEVVRRCAAVLREIARHKSSGFFLFPVDNVQVKGTQKDEQKKYPSLSFFSHTRARVQTTMKSFSHQDEAFFL